MVASFSKIYGKIWVGFCLNTGKSVYLEVSFWTQQRQSIGCSKNGWGVLNSPLFKRSACLYVTISGNFECFQNINFEADFLENENLFQKTEVPFFSWKY